MTRQSENERVADALRVSLSLLIRRVRQTRESGDLTLPETAALKRLEQHGAMTLTSLAKMEEISAQSMGATVASLVERGYIKRSPDPHDGRQTIVSLSKAGRSALADRRNVFTQHVASVLAQQFNDAERDALAAAVPLIERLAQHL